MGVLRVNVGGAWSDVVPATGPAGNGVFTGTEAQRLASVPVSGSRWWATDTKRDWIYDGFGWIIAHEDWHYYNPTNVGGFTEADGNFIARYRRNFGTCEVFATFLFGNNSVIGTDPRFDVPVPPADLTDMEGAQVVYNHRNNLNGRVRCQGAMYSPNGDNGYPDVHFGAINTAGTYASVVPITATIPFVWSPDDYWATQFTYWMGDRHTSGSG